MPKPTPKQEIVVRRFAPEDRLLFITTASDDARSWIESVSHTYGRLNEYKNSGNSFLLSVLRNWDYEEVARYLESGGE